MRLIYNLIHNSATCFRTSLSGTEQGCLVRAVVFVAAIMSLSLLVTASTSASQDELTIFDQGYHYYLSYQPEQAAAVFQGFLNAYPNSSAKDAVLFWFGRSLTMLQHYVEAKQLFLRIKNEIPDSPFIPYVHKELELMNSPGIEQQPMNHHEQVIAEIERLKCEKDEVQRVLAEITAERDRLRALLAEQQMKNEALEEKSDRFDRELQDIMARLEAIRSFRENVESSVTIPHDRQVEATVSTEERDAGATETLHESVRNIVQREGEQSEPEREGKNPNTLMQPDSLHSIELIAKEETWVFVTIDNRDTRQRLLKPGSRITWTAENGFALRIGNAAGIRVIYNGKDLGPLGERGKVVRLKLPNVSVSNSQKDPSKVL